MTLASHSWEEVTRSTVFWVGNGFSITLLGGGHQVHCLLGWKWLRHPIFMRRSPARSLSFGLAMALASHSLEDFTFSIIFWVGNGFDITFLGGFHQIHCLLGWQLLWHHILWRISQCTLSFGLAMALESHSWEEVTRSIVFWIDNSYASHSLEEVVRSIVFWAGNSFGITLLGGGHQFHCLPRWHWLWYHL